MVEEDLRIVRREDLDTEKWDRVIMRSPNGKIFCTSWYLDATAENWEALVGGDYDVIMPLPYTRRSRFKLLYLPFFVRELDVFTGRRPDYSLITRVLHNIPREFRLIRVGFTEHKGVELDRFEVERFSYQTLDLEQDYKTIRAGYSSNAKRMVNKAEKNAVQIKELEDVHIVGEMFEASRGGDIDELATEDFNRLNNLMDQCVKNELGKGFGAYRSGELIASAFYMAFKDRIIYLKGASTDAGRQYGGMYAIMDQVIREYSEEGMVLDFGGSRVEGVREFNMKFGSTDSFYLFLTKNDLPAIVKLAMRFRDRI